MSDSTPPPALEQWELNVIAYREDPRIKSVLTKFEAPFWIPDDSLSDELMAMLKVISQARSDSQYIGSPDQLDRAQTALHHINSYRDRACSIQINVTRFKGEVEHAMTLIKTLLHLKADVQSKNESIKKAITLATAAELNDLLCQWTILEKQCDLVLRNARQSFDCVRQACDNAKTTWWITKDGNAGGTAPTLATPDGHKDLPGNAPVLPRKTPGKGLANAMKVGRG